MNSIGVGGERLQLVGQPRLGLDQRVGHGVRGLRDALGEHLLPRVEHAVVQAHPGAVLDGVQDLGADRVDQRDAGVDEDLRPQVGEAPGDRGAALTTAATSAATSASAVARSRSTWSSTAMSPGRSRRSSAPVSRSTRATPPTPGSSDRVRCNSPESFMHAL